MGIVVHDGRWKRSSAGQSALGNNTFVQIFLTMPSPIQPSDTAIDDCTPPLAAQVLRQFRVVFSEVRRHFRQLERQTGVGGAQLWALSEVRQQPGINLNTLALCMDVHQSTASNLVKQLKKQGLVAIDKRADDRRIVTLHATDSGVTLLNSIIGPPEGVLPHALKQLPSQSLGALKSSLDELIVALRADQAQGQTPLANL